MKTPGGIMKASRRMEAVHMPPIHQIMNRVRSMLQRGETVYSMAQAVPWYGPPEEAVNALALRLAEHSTHLYSPDPGMASSRAALGRDLEARRGISVDPESELHLTCGASQAFLGALLSVADQGDRVIVIEPYYFDHMFAIIFSGVKPDILPMRETTGWELPWEQLEKRIPGARAVVLVNPGNPTGAVLTESELKRLAKATERENCALIIDETYERFNFSGSRWHPWMEAKTHNTLTLGSFSKSFGISGWRLGYLFGPGRLMEQALKVQDSVVICPPTPAQILLEECLKVKGFAESRAEAVQKRLDLCREALKSAEGLQWRESGGGFFTLAACPGKSGYSVSETLLAKYRIGTIPGEAFGGTGGNHVRISFGCLPDSLVTPAMEALASVRL
jgi:aspartate/methionine/tyrosine aminotransferase